jgi:hypothetical protein
MGKYSLYFCCLLFNAGCFNSLACVNVSWIEIPELIQNVLVQKETSVEPQTLREFNSVQLSSILNGLVRMKYEWENDGKMEKAIYEGLIANYHPTKKKDKKYGEIQLANIVYYLGKLSKEREESDKIVLEKEVLDSIWNGIEKCLNQVNPQDVSKLIYG